MTANKPDRPSEKTPLPEPVPPADWECCGSECGEACTFAVYRREKAEYDAQQQALKDKP